MTKKKIQVTNDRFLESVYHIEYFSNLLNHIHHFYVSEDIEKLSKSAKTIANFAIEWLSFIILNSETDELTKFLSKFNEDDNIRSKIESFNVIIKPIIELITENWPDIKLARNTILAHNFRNERDDNKSILFHTNPQLLKIPKIKNEFIALFRCYECINNVALLIFEKELIEAKKILDEKEENLKESNEDSDEKYANFKIKFDYCISHANRSLGDYLKNV